MPSFIDATCPKCKKLYGWCGEITDDPGCPRCGKEPDPKALVHDAAIIQDFKCFLQGKRGIALGKGLRALRVAAQMPLPVAAKKLGVTGHYLTMIENGRTEPAPDVQRAMEALYKKE